MENSNFEPTLRELCIRLNEFEKRMELRFESSDRALLLQAKEIERRLELLNGEQARLAAERGQFLPREIFENFRQASVETIAVTTGRSKGMSDLWGWIFGAAMLAVAILSLVSRWGGR
jgi:hypothetical protein